MSEKWTPTPEMPFRLPLKVLPSINGRGLRDANGTFIGEIAEGEGADSDIHRAAYIVRAVNAHADLYAACKAGRSFLAWEASGVTEEAARKIHVICAKLNDAIAKAEGRQP